MPPALVWTSDRSVRVGSDDPAGLFCALRGAGVPGVVDLTPGFGGVLVEVDPLRVDVGRLEEVVRRCVSSAAEREEPRREHAIEVCYEGVFAPDLGVLAERAGMSVERVIELHSSAEYRVEVIGFSPGFGYLSGLAPELHAARLDSPRTRVPAGSVGIAGEHTGVYPQATPGGWNLIGRTPRVMFDGTREEAALLAVGDVVRFVPIDAARFEELEREVRG
ncbi:MAG: 5-oxoprolinase subunit PxpB [Phycisphaerales bacterium JB065]